MKQHNMWSCSLRVHGCQSLTATDVTATGATATVVNYQHELKESNSVNSTVAALEAASVTVRAEKQTVDSENCGPSFR
jgi:hypothetical protein